MKVTYNGLWYEVGNWTFEEEDKDLAYIEDALAAWTAWKAYVEWERKKAEKKWRDFVKSRVDG